MKRAIVMMAASIATTAGIAFTINSDVYFAYSQAGNRIIGVSKQPCKDKEAAKHQWMRAFYYYPQQEYLGIKDACWKKGKTETIYGTSDFSICWLDNAGKLSGMCEPAQYGALRKTTSLPKRLSASDF